LICVSDVRYTYFQDFTGNNSLIDHIISSRLAHNVSEYTVCEGFANLSDHLPVLCNLTVSVCISESNCPRVRRNQGSRRWDKGDLLSYYRVSYERLSKIYIPFSLLHDKCTIFQRVLLTECLHSKP